jgi:hypothetical protein
MRSMPQGNGSVAILRADDVRYVQSGAVRPYGHAKSKYCGRRRRRTLLHLLRSPLGTECECRHVRYGAAFRGVAVGARTLRDGQN